VDAQDKGRRHSIGHEHLGALGQSVAPLQDLVTRMFPGPGEDKVSIDDRKAISSGSPANVAARGVLIRDHDARQVQNTRSDLHHAQIGMLVMPDAQHGVPGVEVEIDVLVKGSPGRDHNPGAYALDLRPRY